MSETQNKLGKARPPRVHITYDVEVGGAETQKELPMVIGVVGEFSDEKKPLRDRRFVQIDKDNFNEVMQGMKPEIEMLVDNELNNDGGKLAVALRFNSMADFAPENVAQQLEPLKKLLELREQLSDLRNRTASNDRLKEQLAELLARQTPATKTDSEGEQAE
ncbi:type VI secretion system contractile sheath small subunit [Enterobacter asburiae]